MSDANQPPHERIEFSVGETSTPPGEVIPYSEPVIEREVLVDGLANVHVANGLLRLSFFVERSDPENGGKATRPIVARLVMTTLTAAGVSQSLSDILQTMVREKVIPALPEVVRK